jgi:hypothetical protein
MTSHGDPSGDGIYLDLPDEQKRAIERAGGDPEEDLPRLSATSIPKEVSPNLRFAAFVGCHTVEDLLKGYADRLRLPREQIYSGELNAKGKLFFDQVDDVILKAYEGHSPPPGLQARDSLLPPCPRYSAPAAGVPFPAEAGIRDPDAGVGSPEAGASRAPHREGDGQADQPEAGYYDPSAPLMTMADDEPTLEPGGGAVEGAARGADEAGQTEGGYYDPPAPFMTMADDEPTLEPGGGAVEGAAEGDPDADQPGAGYFGPSAPFMTTADDEPTLQAGGGAVEGAADGDPEADQPEAEYYDPSAPLMSEPPDHPGAAEGPMPDDVGPGVP